LLNYGREEMMKKNNLAQKITDTVAEELKVDIGDISVAFEEVSSSDWGEQVYKKEIKDNSNIYLKPNYEYE
jgi:phenylpyruvate tautomerase PptA (4-oxalocrotonate tautomerase family)